MFSSTPVDLINTLEKLHSDSIIKAYFYCVFLTSVTQRGSKIEFTWLEEHGGSDLFVMSGWRGILVFSEIKWKDSKWSSNANVVSITHVEGGVVIDRAWEMLLFQTQEIKGQREQVTLEKENARPYLA